MICECRWLVIGLALSVTALACSRTPMNTIGTGEGATTGGTTYTIGNTGGGGTTRFPGGTTSAGGTVASGGTTRAGGITITGGTTASGGMTSAGGTTTAGGMTSAGGTTTAGGTKASGGTSSAGGTVGRSGGVVATGGSSGSGGSAACSDVAPCGGDVTGTWTVTSSCLKLSRNLDASFAGLDPNVCKNITITGSLYVSGTWTANSNGTYADNTTTTGSGQIQVPAACKQISGTTITCDRVGLAVGSGTGYTVTCIDAANGNDCTCTATVQQTGWAGWVSPDWSTNGNYATASNVLTFDSEAKYSYCVSGSTMTWTPQIASPTLTGTVVFQKNGSDSGTSPPSCSGLAATCGPSGNDDCCKSLLVPGGTFYRSYDGVAPYTDPNYPATVSDFYLDKYEITVGRFRQFVNAGMGTQVGPPAAGAGANPLIAGSGWDSAWNTSLAADTTSQKTAMSSLCGSYGTWTDTAGSNESQPVNCLDWYTAFAFCAWDGGRLATEAEWNYAASGGSEQRYYPWSNPPTSTTIDDSYAVYCGGSCSGTRNVGSKSPQGDGKWGQSDLAGNVWEWTLDSYASSYSTPCNNCADLTAGSARVGRGGGYYSPTPYLRSADRAGDFPEFHVSGIGSRCARTSL